MTRQRSPGSPTPTAPALSKTQMLLAAAALVCLAMPTSRFQHAFPLFATQRVASGLLQRLGATVEFSYGQGVPRYGAL